MERISIRANPKLNLSLTVLKKPKGAALHPIISEMAEAEGNIYDTVSVELTPSPTDTFVKYTDGRV